VAVRCAEEQQSWQGQRLGSNAVIDRLLERLDASMDRAFAGCTLKDLVVEQVATVEEGGDEGA
jgi:DNA-binding IscR family transcriptional regulator